MIWAVISVLVCLVAWRSRRNRDVELNLIEVYQRIWEQDVIRTPPQDRTGQ